MAEPLEVVLSKDGSSFGLCTTNRTTVWLPFNAAGVACLRRILYAREDVSHAIISTPAAPTQYQIDEMIRAFSAAGGEIKTPKKDAPADLTLAMLGL